MKKILLLLSISFSFSTAIYASSLPTEYRFAEVFFTEQDYYRAATEYQRQYFTQPKGEERDIGVLRAAESYYLGQQGDLCLNELAEITKNSVLEQRASFLSVFCAAQLGQYQLAANKAQKTWPTPFGSHQYSLFMSYYTKGPLFPKNGLLTSYDRPLPNGLEYPLASWEYAAFLQNEGTPYKSPLLASFLSTVLPGSGQWYYGSWGDGITSFSAITFFALLGVLAAGNDETLLATFMLSGAGVFYAAGIYGAWRGAERANENNRHEMAKKLDQLSLRYTVYRFN